MNYQENVQWPAWLGDPLDVLLPLALAMASILFLVSTIRSAIRNRKVTVFEIALVILLAFSTTKMAGVAGQVEFEDQPGIVLSCSPPGNTLPVAAMYDYVFGEPLSPYQKRCKHQARVRIGIAFSLWSLSTGLYVRSRRSARKTA